MTPIYRMGGILEVFGMDKGDLGDGMGIPAGAGMTVEGLG